MKRHENYWQLDEVKKKVPRGLQLNESQLEEKLSAYRKLVVGTGIVDFEPRGSELLSDNKPKPRKLESQSSDREVKLQKAWKILKANNVNGVVRAIKRWNSLVSYDDPFWVIEDEHQIQNCIAFLNQIGFDLKDIKIWATNSCKLDIPLGVLENYQDNVYRRNAALSKSPPMISTSEFAIAVEEATGSNRRNSRELHRLLLILNACLPELVS
jgi:hypothetical protein